MKTDSEASVEFNRFKDTYSDDIEKSISFSGQSHDFFIRIKADYLLNHIAPLFKNNEPLQVLDVGCGHGLAHGYLLGKAEGKVTLSGVDPAETVIGEARLANPGVRYEASDGDSIPFGDNTFDVVQAVCVMHHVPPENWAAFLKEVRRVLKPGGQLFVFEHNPYNPLTLYAVNTCPLDENAVLLNDRVLKNLIRQAGFSSINRDFIIFFPFDKPIFRNIENHLRSFPLGAQYAIHAKKAFS
jgi:SAM-dependent methyltransferase